MAKYKFKIFVVLLIAVVCVIGYEAGTGYIKSIKSGLTLRYEKEIQSIEDQAYILENQKIEALKEDILDRLKSCESGDMTLEEAPIILDTNDKMSIGLYMFQRDTVVYYWEKFYGKKITRKRAVEISIGEEARSLAKKIIFEETGGIFNWANCAKRERLVPEITVIKKLQ